MKQFITVFVLIGAVRLNINMNLTGFVTFIFNFQGSCWPTTSRVHERTTARQNFLGMLFASWLDPAKWVPEVWSLEPETTTSPTRCTSNAKGMLLERMHFEQHRNYGKRKTWQSCCSQIHQWKLGRGCRCNQSKSQSCEVSKASYFNILNRLSAPQLTIAKHKEMPRRQNSTKWQNFPQLVHRATWSQDLWLDASLVKFTPTAQLPSIRLNLLAMHWSHLLPTVVSCIHQRSEHKKLQMVRRYVWLINW